jgi:tetratricopeptide (TPR) repeat protein
MRLLLLIILTFTGGLYCLGAFRSFREDELAKNPLETLSADEIPRHPEANLRVLRDAFASNNYADNLVPRLNAALLQAPSFYQPPFLMAAFYANRLEKPETVRASFESSLARFPSNGRLHLTYAEWLLTPRETAPYRVYRVTTTERLVREERDLALNHVERATALEPDLARDALLLMLRTGIPASEWAERIPREPGTKPLLLEALDRAPRDPSARRTLLEELLSDSQEDMVVLRACFRYARRWGERDVALEAATRWHQAALEIPLGDGVTGASVALVTVRLERGETDLAYGTVRDTLAKMEARGLPEELTIELLTGAGEAYLNAGSSAMAQGLLSEAAALSPYDVRPLLGLARVHQTLNETQEAIDLLERVLELDPSNVRARRELDALLEKSLATSGH